MEKRSVMSGLGVFYSKSPTGLAPLPFVYNNILSLAKDLSPLGWITNTPLLDEMASVKYIRERLIETIKKGNNDQWLLFYFTGHASKYYVSPDSEPVTFCVTYFEDLIENSYPDLSCFFSGKDYEEIVNEFAAHCPNGHLITILDCCYAYGLISDFSIHADFHTIIAATAKNSKALYDDNSVFYKEFKKVLGRPLNTMQSLINASLKRQRIPKNCIIRPAPNFESSTL